VLLVAPGTSYCYGSVGVGEAAYILHKIFN